MKESLWAKIKNVETYQAVLSKVATIVAPVKKYLDTNIDKVARLTISFMMVIFMSLFLGPYIAVILTAGVGILKEYMDEHFFNSKWDYKDLIANSIGIILAIIYLVLK